MILDGPTVLLAGLLGGVGEVMLAVVVAVSIQGQVSHTCCERVPPRPVATVAARHASCLVAAGLQVSVSGRDR